MATKGMTDLHQLLAEMQPQMQPGDYVFCCAKETAVPDGMRPIGTFREAEGLTLIVEREQAELLQLAHQGVYRMITLRVHSSLETVGFLAAVSAALAAEGIPCNAVSAMYHDHLFIPADFADKAMRRLQVLSKASK